jgi:hypothetical protein
VKRNNWRGENSFQMLKESKIVGLICIEEKRALDG